MCKEPQIQNTGTEAVSWTCAALLHLNHSLELGIVLELERARHCRGKLTVHRSNQSKEDRQESPSPNIQESALGGLDRLDLEVDMLEAREFAHVVDSDSRVERQHLRRTGNTVLWRNRISMTLIKWTTHFSTMSSPNDDSSPAPYAFSLPPCRTSPNSAVYV